MASKNENGQMLLLAGILIVVAFILFGIQTSQLAQLGQATGRQLQRPLTEDYLLTRRALETYLPNELRDAAGVIRCPSDLTEYQTKTASILSLVSAYSENRGQSFLGKVLSVTKPSATQVEVKFRLTLADGETTASDEITFLFTCTP